MQPWKHVKNKLDYNGQANWLSEKPSSISAEKNLLLLNPSKTKMVFYSVMGRTTLVDGEYLKDLLNQSLSKLQHAQGTFRGG